MDAVQQIRDKAVQLLARREHSARELQNKLSGAFDAELVATVIESIALQGLQSDDRFAAGLVRGRIQQGHGPVRIDAELKQKGVNTLTRQKAFEDNSVDWMEQVASVFQRKFGSQPASDPKSRAKQVRFLQYRGFTMDQIRHALDSAGR